MTIIVGAATIVRIGGFIGFISRAFAGRAFSSLVWFFNWHVYALVFCRRLPIDEA
jgi:hypothetical protein